MFVLHSSGIRYEVHALELGNRLYVVIGGLIPQGLSAYFTEKPSTKQTDFTSGACKFSEIGGRTKESLVRCYGHAGARILASMVIEDGIPSSVAFSLGSPGQKVKNSGVLRGTLRELASALPWLGYIGDKILPT